MEPGGAKRTRSSDSWGRRPRFRRRAGHARTVGSRRVLGTFLYTVPTADFLSVSLAGRVTAGT